MDARRRDLPTPQGLPRFFEAGNPTPSPFQHGKRDEVSGCWGSRTARPTRPGLIRTKRFWLLGNSVRVQVGGQVGLRLRGWQKGRFGPTAFGVHGVRVSPLPDWDRASKRCAESRRGLGKNGPIFAVARGGLTRGRGEPGRRNPTSYPVHLGVRPLSDSQREHAGAPNGSTRGTVGLS
jgi:hypothetical protein